MTLSSGDAGASGRSGVLYLDLEGGRGGSSRSMYYLIAHLDRDAWHPVAVTRRDGPIAERYAALGVAHECLPAIPSFRPSERKNPVAYAIYLWGLRRLPQFLDALRRLVVRHDIRLLHINHESLALVGRLLARRLDLPWVCHVRTQLIPGAFARYVYKAIARDAAHVIFITEPNRDHFARLAGRAFNTARSSVVYNIAPPMDSEATPLPELEATRAALKVVSLTNFSPNRGVDQIIDVALALRAAGRNDVVFFLYGALANTRRLPGARNSYLEQIEQRILREGLGDGVRLPGHTDRPERALAGAGALIKLTRQSNPWGRDIIEALVAGVPVIALGEFEGFVENGINGYLMPRFDPAAIAAYLAGLADDPVLRVRIAEANREKAARLFDGATRAGDVAAIYRTVLTSCG